MLHQLMTVGESAGILQRPRSVVEAVGKISTMVLGRLLFFRANTLRRINLLLKAALASNPWIMLRY